MLEGFKNIIKTIKSQHPNMLVCDLAVNRLMTKPRSNFYQGILETNLEKYLTKSYMTTDYIWATDAEILGTVKSYWNWYTDIEDGFFLTQKVFLTNIIT